MSTTVYTKNAPEAIGPYSQAKVVGGLVFTSGQIPIDPATGHVVEGDIKAQAHQSCKNVKAILEEAGSSLDKVVKIGGYVCIIIGDTKTTTGVGKEIIRTTEVLRETGKHLCWKLVSDIPISVTKEKYVHMNNSITENNILIFRKQK